MDFNGASLFKRFTAGLIDLAIGVVLILITAHFVDDILNMPISYDFKKGFSVEMDDWTQEHFWELVIIYSLTKLFVLYLYFSIMESSKYQGTMGKIWTGIKVTDIFGNRIRFSRATIRFF